MRGRLHVLGVDDAPFIKRQDGDVPLIAVMMEGATLVEGVATTTFAVDGSDATTHLATWIGGLRWSASLQAIVLGGVTIAGLGLVDIVQLAQGLGLPVLAVTRKPTDKSRLARALSKAGLDDRLPILDRLPPARRLREGLHASFAGIDARAAAKILDATSQKSHLPEPLRVAHLIGAAMVRGQSRGRV